MYNYYQPYMGINPYPQNAFMQNQYQTQQTAQPDSGIIWVQGEAGANAHPVAPGCAVVLFDSTQKVFYIKSADQSGKPQPLEAYTYEKRSDQQEPDMSQYVTKTEVNQYISEIKKYISENTGGSDHE